MSVQALGAPTLANGLVAAAGPAAAAQRIQQLQNLIAEVQGGPAGFAATLQAAQTGPAPTALARTSSPQGLPVGAYATASGAIPVSNVGVTTVASPTGGPTGSQYDGLIEQAAVRNGVDPAILHGLIQQESGFDPNSTSGAGAVGLTQLMPGTAASLGVTNPLDPAQSIEGGAHYLGEMLRQFGGSTEEALAAYNAGPGAVQRYGGVPPYSETQQYVTKVLGYAAEYRQSHPTDGIVQPGGAASPQAAIA